jgi:hypothetical protein
MRNRPEIPANPRFLDRLQCRERHAAEVSSACPVAFSESEIVGGSVVRYRPWPPPLHTSAHPNYGARFPTGCVTWVGTIQPALAEKYGFRSAQLKPNPTVERI